MMPSRMLTSHYDLTCFLNPGEEATLQFTPLGSAFRATHLDFRHTKGLDELEVLEVRVGNTVQLFTTVSVNGRIEYHDPYPIPALTLHEKPIPCETVSCSMLMLVKLRRKDDGRIGDVHLRIHGHEVWG